MHPRTPGRDSPACGAPSDFNVAFHWFHAHYLMLQRKHPSAQESRHAELGAAAMRRVTCAECRVVLDRALEMRPEPPKARKQKKRG